LVTAAFGVVASVWPVQRQTTGMDEQQEPGATLLLLAASE
jgi:hypothetical protein